MEFHNFKDEVFELLNENDWTDLKDIEVHDRESIFLVSFRDGSQFELSLRKTGAGGRSDHSDRVRWEFFEKVLPKLLYSMNGEIRREAFESLRDNGQEFICSMLRQMCEEDGAVFPYEPEDFEVTVFDRHDIHFIQMNLPPYNPGINDIVRAYVLYTDGSDRLYFLLKYFTEGGTALLYVSPQLQIWKTGDLAEHVEDMNYEHWKLAADYRMILHDMQSERAVQGYWSRDWRKVDWTAVREKIRQGKMDIGLTEEEYLEFLHWCVANETEICEQTIFYLALKKFDFPDDVSRYLAAHTDKLREAGAYVKR